MFFSVFVHKIVPNNSFSPIPLNPSATSHKLLPSSSIISSQSSSFKFFIISFGDFGLNTDSFKRSSFSGVVFAESVQEDYDALSGTSPAPDADNAGGFSLTMTGNTTFSFGGVTSGRAVGFVLQLTGNGSTVTWPSSVDWAGGTAPDAPASGASNLYVFYTRDGGTNWIGVLSAAAYA